MSTLRRLIVLGGVLETLSVIGCASTGMHAAQPAHPYRYSVVDVPVSLAPGLARTPAFTPPQVVTHGSSVGSAAAIFTNENIFRFLGGFPTKRGRTYVVDVTFIRDGTALDIANPHLIVVRQGLE